MENNWEKIDINIDNYKNYMYKYKNTGKIYEAISYQKCYCGLGIIRTTRGESHLDSFFIIPKIKLPNGVKVVKI